MNDIVWLVFLALLVLAIFVASGWYNDDRTANRKLWRLLRDVIREDNDRDNR